MNQKVVLGAACAILALALLAVGAQKAHPRKVLNAVAHLATTAAPQSAPTPATTRINRYHEPYKPKRLDSWQIIGPGGGGAFYNVTVSPHDPNLVVATTDMTGCFASEDGGKTWRQFNLRMTCRQLIFDPKLPNRIYSMNAQAGIYRSDDRGHTWSLVYPAPAKSPGFWFMDDEGEAWLQYGVGSGPAPVIQALAIDPDDSNVLFANTQPDLLTSTDAGKTWRVIGKIGSASSIYVDPTSPRDQRAIWAVYGVVTGVWDGSAFHGNLKREESGTRWITGSAFGAAKDGKPVLYTASDYFAQNGVYKGGGILGTHDGGMNWFSLNDTLLATVYKATFPEFTAMGVSSRHPESVYAAVKAWRLPDDNKPGYGVIGSKNGGKTWTSLRREYTTTAPNMHDAWLSDRWGPDWGEQPLSFGVGPDNPDLVYTTDLGRIMRSTDGGKNWEAVYSQGTANGYTTTGLDNTTCYGVHFDPFDPKHMFIGYTDIGMFASQDGGASWMSATVNGVPRAWVGNTYWIEFDPKVPGRIWAAQSNMHDLPRMRMFKSPGRELSAKGGIVYSEDGGKSWKVSSQGMPEMAPTDIVLDPKSPVGARVLYVTGFGRGVYKSVDGGKSWTLKNTGLPATEPLTWRMALGNDGALYVVTIRRSEELKTGTPEDGMIFRSRDGAESWERMKLPEGVNGPVSITIDPKDPKRLYVSAWGRYILYGFGVAPADGGVFLSTDGGDHWKNVLEQSRRISDVTIDPRDPAIVYAAGHEASAYRSTDRGLTWRRIRGFNFKNAQRVIPSPTDPSKIYITTFGSSVWYGPAEGDPNAVEDIVSPESLRFEAPQLRGAPKK